MSTDIARPGRAQVKARLDQRFALSVCFEEYHRSRLEGREGTNPIKPSETTGSLSALYQVAQSLHMLITNWTRAAPFTPGDANDPQTFWDLAQPWQELTDDERADILQTYNFTRGPTAVAPGLIDIYVQLILDPRFLKTHSLIIDCVLWSFGALFAVACRDPKGFITGPSQSSASSLILVHTGKIWQHFWDNRYMIPLRPQSARDAQKYMPWDVSSNEYGFWPEPFSRLIDWYSYLYDHHDKYLQHHATPAQRARELSYPRLRDTCMPFVGLYLWVFEAPNDGILDTTIDPNHMLSPLGSVLLDHEAEDTPEDIEEIERIGREAVRDGVGADAFFERFVEKMRHLRAAKPKHDPWIYIIIVVCLAQTKALLQFLSKHNIWQPMMAICNSYPAQGSYADRQSAWAVVQRLFWYIGARLVESFDGDGGDELVVRVNGEDLVDYLALGIDFASEKDFDIGSNPDGFERLEDQIILYSELIAASKDKTDHRSEAKDKLINELTSRASSLWWPSRRRLEIARDRDRFTASPLVNQYRRDVLKNWKHLGASLGLNTASERRRFITSHCSWGSCQYHTNKPPDSVPLKSCKGCGEVKYCSRPCQVSHWKQEHKGKCGKRLHAG